MGGEPTFAASMMNEWDAQKADISKAGLMSLASGVEPPEVAGSIYHDKGRG